MCSSILGTEVSCILVGTVDVAVHCPRVWSSLVPHMLMKLMQVKLQLLSKRGEVNLLAYLNDLLVIVPPQDGSLAAIEETVDVARSVAISSTFQSLFSFRPSLF